MPNRPRTRAPAAVLVLYDGGCGLCQRSTRFLQRLDRAGRLDFAPLQGAAGRAVRARHPQVGETLDSVVVVEDPGQPTERVWTRSAALLRALAALGGAWRLVRLAALVPTRWRDRLYDLVAASRGRAGAACAVPPRDDGASGPDRRTR